LHRQAARHPSPGHPHLASKGDFLAVVALLKAGGFTELAFSNWGHLRRRNLACTATH
jgi:hypothetical protein